MNFPSVFAQASWPDYSSPVIQFYFVVAALAIVAVTVLIAAAVMLRVIQTLADLEAQRQAEAKGEAYRPQPSFWNRIWQRAHAWVPLEQERDILLDHEYDGIRELDNHLPPWWTWLFYATIAFSAVYLVVYHVTDMLPSSEEEYRAEVQKGEEQMRAFRAQHPVDENSVTLLNDPVALAEGKALYLANCASCHLADGGGDIGPNLTDRYWLHGGSIKHVFTVVKNGVAGTNMVAWGQVLSPQSIQSVSSYVLTLRGTTPARAKEPQGDPYPADSLKTQVSLH